MKQNNRNDSKMSDKNESKRKLVEERREAYTENIETLSANELVYIRNWR